MSQRGEIVGVQYLRGLAACAVVVDHAAGTLGQAKYFDTTLLGGVLTSGRIGADLFFLISGFIIAAVSLEGPGLTPTIDRTRFFARRFARVVPVMWIAILSYALLRGFGRGMHDLDDYARALFLVPYGEVKPQTIWTLRQELIFYIVFALAMLGPKPMRWLMLLWILAPAVMWWPRRHLPPGSIPFEFLRIFFHPTAYEFGAGFLIAVLWFRRTRETVIRLPIEPMLAVTLAFGFPLAVTAASQFYLGYRPSALTTALCCAPVLFLGVHVYCPPGLGQRIGRTLGDASYAIYLFHPHILSITILLWSRLIPGTPPLLVAGVTTVAAIAGGVVLHHIVERPVVRASRRLFDRRPLSVEASPANPVPPEPAPAPAGH